MSKPGSYSQQEGRLHRLQKAGPVTVTTTTALDRSGETVFTREQLEKYIKVLAPPADPLNGANAVYVTKENEHHARRLAAAYLKPLHIHVSKYASPKVIACFRDTECVAIIRIGEQE